MPTPANAKRFRATPEVSDAGAGLRFDFRGSGDSAGDSEDMTIRSEVADGLEAIRFP